MKKCIKVLTLLVIAIAFVIAPGVNANASAKSNATKMVKAYKAKKYKKANTYADKLSDKVKIPKMTSKMKKAFRKKVKSYSTEQDYSSKDGWIYGYYLADLDGDKKAELLVKHGTCEADYRTDIYKYTKGKAKRIATQGSGHCSYFAYPGHKGILVYWGHMGSESLSILAMKNNKLVTTGVGSRILDSRKPGEYLHIKGLLEDHVSTNYNSATRKIEVKVDYSDLK